MRALANKLLGIGTLVSLLIAATPSAARSGVAADLEPDSALVSPGDTVAVQVVVPDADSEFNAFDLVIAFDPALLALVPATDITEQIGPVMTDACSNYFHLFTPHPADLDVNLSMLCNDVVVRGPGVIYQVRFRALAPFGRTTLTWGEATDFYRVGHFVRPAVLTPMTLFVCNAVASSISAAAGPHGSISPSGAVAVGCGRDQAFVIEPEPPSSIADVLVDGSSVGPVGSYAFTNVTSDHSISASFTAQSGVDPDRSGDARPALGPLQPNPYRGSGPLVLTFHLPAAESLRFEVLDSQGRRVASRPSSWHAAGRGSLQWEGLRLRPGCYVVRMISSTHACRSREWVVLR